MFLKREVIEIKQPLGVFYAVSIDAYSLLKIVDAEPYRANIDGTFSGIQRPENKSRLRSIAEYLKGYESAMPNSIILSGNSFPNSERNDEDKWFIENREGRKYLIIPNDKKVGSIIDGQHRLRGFADLSTELQKSYNILCAIYLDLPNPYQAYLFATININQKPVDKSLAYELYGYNLDEEDSDSWSPEKLAVYLTRKLNHDKESIFFNHILIAAENDEVLYEIKPEEQEWIVSTASIVDGILPLITSNAKRDRDFLQQQTLKDRKRSKLSNDNTPLRDYFKQGNDLLIYTIINNFFTASFSLLYKEDSYLYKTVGVQAQFYVLKEILKHLEIDKDISVKYYESYLKKCIDINFHDNFFTASGLGKNRIQNAILIRLQLKDIISIKNNVDLENYKRLLSI